jgi:hypothetical protein
MQTIAYVIQRFELETEQPEIIIIAQGDTASAFYVLAKGECRCLIKDELDR